MGDWIIGARIGVEIMLHGDYHQVLLPSFPTQHQVVYLVYFGPKPKTLKSTGGCIEDHTDVVISL